MKPFSSQPREDGFYQLSHLLPVPTFLGESDNQVFAASTGLNPLLPPHDGDERWQETKSETVECEVPIRVLAGNTAFVVHPTVHVV